MTREVRRQIVKEEIKKLNGLIAQFRSEDENFMNEQNNSHMASDRNSESAHDLNMPNPEINEDFASSQDSVNQAFVMSKEGESEENGFNQDSPIFNPDALNDTSSFFHDGHQDLRKDKLFYDDEINFNPGELNGV